VKRKERESRERAEKRSQPQARAGTENHTRAAGARGKQDIKKKEAPISISISALRLLENI